ncbi:hypothetical protein FGRMN_5392 [Fusarium graminum]|nr:hypothetical protein FGRMN_5392 [Fusarium graminum]
MRYLSKNDMFRLGRCDPTKEALVALDTLDINEFVSCKKNPDFRMFLKRVVGIKKSYSEAMDLKRTQEWACEAMCIMIMEEREKEARDAEEEVAKKVVEAEKKAIEAEKTGPIFEGDNLIAF